MAALLNVEREVEGVTIGTVRPELRKVGVPARFDSRPFDPSGGDAALTAEWGRLQNGSVFGGRGTLTERPVSGAEGEAIGDAITHLAPGGFTLDVHLNDEAAWLNVPPLVWNYNLGGYPVLKKWLSYRDRAVLGRDLSADEVRHFQRSARRIASLLLLHPALDAAHADCSEATLMEA